MIVAGWLDGFRTAALTTQAISWLAVIALLILAGALLIAAIAVGVMAEELDEDTVEGHRVPWR